MQCLLDKETGKVYRVGADGSHSLVGRNCSLKQWGGEEYVQLTRRALFSQIAAMLVYLLDSPEVELRELGARASAINCLKHAAELGQYSGGIVTSLMRLMRSPLEMHMQILVAQGLTCSFVAYFVVIVILRMYANEKGTTESSTHISERSRLR
eukprot:3940287-Pyramimonas_sp.AAC.1